MRALILSDGKAGHLNQSVAFCKLKGLGYDIVEIKINFYKKALCYLFGFLDFYMDLFGLDLKRDSFDVVVSCGSSTYYEGIFLAKKFNKKCVAIMLPSGFKFDRFDYIVANLHDRPPKMKNIVQIPISLSVSEPKNIIDIKSGAVGIIIGGENGVFKMDKKSFKKRLDDIVKKHKNSPIYVTTSRRTPKEIEELVEEYGFEYSLIWSKNKEINPMPDFLNGCEYLYITIDSTSMLSEARANSRANIEVIELESNQQDTKYHRLAKIVKELDRNFSYKEYLDRIEL